MKINVSYLFITFRVSIEERIFLSEDKACDAIYPEEKKLLEGGNIFVHLDSSKI